MSHTHFEKFSFYLCSALFGFDLISGQFGTSEGILTLKELYKEKYDDIWVDVRDHMTNEIEDYIW